MRGIRIVALGALGFAVVACTTITEELPTRANPTTSQNPVTLPVVVVPVPVPTPNNPDPAPTTPTNPSNPSAPSNPNPPDTGVGIPPDIPDNQSPVTKLGAKVYFVECGGQEVPGSGGASEVQVGCRVHLDVTPKDASNRPTQVRHTPEWSFSNMGIISISSTSGFNPTFIAKARGDVTAYAEADGVRSNDVTVRIR
jgi:hypothetical protein